MARGHMSKRDRQKELIQRLDEDPFITDEELSEGFGVSIQTIRLDRLELGIPELRERIRNVAAETHKKIKTIEVKEIIGEIVDIELGISGISILETTEDMVFEKTKIVRGHYIFAQAESLAIAVIDSKVALTGVANIKYKTPIYAGDKLVAKAQVVRRRGNKYFVWVMIRIRREEAFRGKFILVSVNEDRGEENCEINS